MSSEPTFELDRDGPWLSAYVDGELSPAEITRVEGWLAASEAARREVERLRELGALTAAFTLRDAPAEAWEVFWRQPLHRAERRLAWVLLAAGVIAVGAWGLWRGATALWSSPGMPIAVKAGIYAAAAGLVVLLVSVARERVFTRARTRYKDWFLHSGGKDL